MWNKAEAEEQTWNLCNAVFVKHRTYSHVLWIVAPLSPFKSLTDEVRLMKSDIKSAIIHMTRSAGSKGSHWLVECVIACWQEDVSTAGSLLFDWLQGCQLSLCLLSSSSVCLTHVQIPPPHTHIPQGRMSEHISRLWQICGLTGVGCSAVGRLNTPGALQTSAGLLCSYINMN